MISIVCFNRTLVKRLTKSKEIISYPSGVFIFRIFSTNSLVFFMVYFELPSGANIRKRYWNVLCVAVPTFEMNGRKGSLPILSTSSGFSLCTFKVPYISLDWIPKGKFSDILLHQLRLLPHIEPSVSLLRWFLSYLVPVPESCLY